MPQAPKLRHGRRESFEAQKTRLAEARRDPNSPQTLAFLRQALARSGSYLAAGAARIVGDSEIHGLEADLVAAFARFLVDPLRSDPGCHAKSAIAEAIRQIGSSEAEPVLLQGVRHVQMEPVYGGREDTAVSLRGTCALGLAQSGHPRAVVELTHLLADHEAPARMAAARALGDTGRLEAVPLLRFKALIGDEDARVVGECFAALLHLSPEGSLEFVAGFLRGSPLAIAEAAAVSLGESRLAEASRALSAWWRESPPVSLRGPCLLALALLRTQEAVDLLLEVVRIAPRQDALGAIEALATYRGDALLAGRVLDAAESRESGEFREVVRRTFSENGG